MKPLSFIYHKEDFRHYLSKREKQPYSKLNIKEFILKEKNETLLLKIRDKRKYQFKKISFKQIKSLDIWFAKFPETNDLMILKKNKKDNSVTLDIYIDQWNYKTLIISSLIL